MFVVPWICTQCVFHENKSNFNAGIYIVMTILNTNLGLSQISPQRMYQFDCVIFMINWSKSHLILPPSSIYLFIPLIYHLFISFTTFLFALMYFYLLYFINIPLFIYTYLIFITWLIFIYFILFALLYFSLLDLFHLFVNSIVNLLVATTKFIDFYQIIYCRYSNPEQTGWKSVWCEMLNFGLLSVENTRKQTQFQSIRNSLNQ